MSVTVALINFLRSRGMPADEILQAVEVVENARTDDMRSAYEMQPVDEAAERRRARDRERKRAARKSAEICGNSAELVSSPASPSSSPPITPLTTTPSPPPSAKEKRARGARLPDDWQPSAKVAADALTILGGDAGRYDRECDKFRDHWRAASGANAIKSNWDAAWRNWCRNAMERFGTGPPRGPANVAPFPQQPRNTAYEAAKRIRDSLAASAEPDASIRSGASGNDDRMLQTGQRGFGGASGDGDYFDARPIPARGY